MARSTGLLVKLVEVTFSNRIWFVTRRRELIQVPCDVVEIEISRAFETNDLLSRCDVQRGVLRTMLGSA